MRGRVWRYIGAGLGLVLLICVLAAIGLNAKTQSGKSMLADFVSRAASTENMKLDIGAIEGPLSAHPMLRDISLADKDGVWLKIDHVEMDWSRLPLASLRVDIDSVAIGRVDVLRRPIPAPAAATKTGGARARQESRRRHGAGSAGQIPPGRVPARHLGAGRAGVGRAGDADFKPAPPMPAPPAMAPRRHCRRGAPTPLAR